MTKINSLSPAFRFQYFNNQHPIMQEVLKRSLLDETQLSDYQAVKKSNKEETLLKVIFYLEDNTILACFPDNIIDTNHDYFQTYSTKEGFQCINPQYIKENCTLATKNQYSDTELQLNLLGYVLEIVNESIQSPINY
jgi:hypothetical protein